MTLMFGSSPLSRAQREMMAVVVSAANQCVYCQQHHGEALNHYWKDKSRVEALRSNFRTANLGETDLRLCEYAITLTKEPTEVSGHVEALRRAGLSDRAVLDAALVIAYFNFVNRIVLGLGVQLEDEGADGYNY